MNKFAPLHPKVNTLLHGADYNPEQWENDPDIIDKDIAMMQQAKCNVMSVGIFSWAKLEPREGVFDFAWLDTILDKLYAAGIHVFLATPSGARPFSSFHILHPSLRKFVCAACAKYPPIRLAKIDLLS